ncbi:unnamed protein product [Ascophyllum nodosum]
MNRFPASGFEQRASILQGSEELIVKLVCEGTTPEQWAEWLRAPLEHAAAQANYKLVEKLLKAGANGKAGWRGCLGRTVLDAAAEGGSEKVVSALLDAGSKPDINTKTKGTHCTPLHRAARGGHADAARILLMAGANVDSLDIGQCTPLHLAFVKDGDQLACDLLLSGANPGAQDVYGFCPIHYAASRGRDRSVQLMLHKGVDVNIRNTRGLTPLHAAAIAGRVDAATILLGAGADSGASDALGNTPLHHAAEHNRYDIVQALVNAGANTVVRAADGWTPLHRAVFHGSSAAMLALLRQGVDVKVTTNAGWSALHVACWRGNPDAAEILLRWGADEQSSVPTGKTARDLIPSIKDASDKDLPALEQLARLLAHAPRDRAWRRRGVLVLCRARLGVDRARRGAGRNDAGGVATRGHSTGGARKKQAKREVVFVGGASRTGACSAGSASSRGTARGEKVADSGSVDVVAWAVGLKQAVLFRKIIGYL